MPALVIKSFPEDLHSRLRQIAASHRRSVTQETIHLIEKAIFSEENAAQPGTSGQSKWANRKLLPEYEALLNSGALTSNADIATGDIRLLPLTDAILDRVESVFATAPATNGIVMHRIDLKVIINPFMSQFV